MGSHSPAPPAPLTTTSLLPVSDSVDLPALDSCTEPGASKAPPRLSVRQCSAATRCPGGAHALPRWLCRRLCARPLCPCLGVKMLCHMVTLCLIY